MSIKVLPSMEHHFTIKTKGSETGQMFEGTFTYKRPNLRKKSDIAKEKARLNGDLKNLDEDTAFLHGILSTLKFTISNAPEWWIKADLGFELFDLNVILDVYKACQDFENQWFNLVWKEEEPKKEESK